MESMNRNDTYERMNKDFENQALQAARTWRQLRQAGLLGNAWYCCLLVRLGDYMVSSGTWLKVHYAAIHQ